MKGISYSEFRIESKYVSSQFALNKFHYHFSNFGFINIYPSRYVYSLYYDDSRLTAIKENLAGISSRRKYRLRWYSLDKKDFYGSQFEIKFKKGNCNSKKIFNFNDEFDVNNSDFSINSIFKSLQNKKSSYDLIKAGNLSPRIICRYKRKYYENSNGYRITIDTDLKFLGLAYLNKIDIDSNWRSSNINILELKFNPSEYLNLVDLIKKFPLTSTRCSKYVLANSVLYGVSYL